MQVKFEFAIYDEALDNFELDEKVYYFELDEEQTQTYNLLKDTDLHLYNWFKESDFFLNWLKEEVYPDAIAKKIVLCDINDTSFRGYYFFKVTSADVFYEYFKKLFNIYHETDWQDREEVGKQILEQLAIKRQELIVELNEETLEDEQKEEEKANQL